MMIKNEAHGRVVLEKLAEACGWSVVTPGAWDAAEAITFDRNRTIRRGNILVGFITINRRRLVNNRWRGVGPWDLLLKESSGVPVLHSQHRLLRHAKAAAIAALSGVRP